jgi:hypothetical protein
MKTEAWPTLATCDLPGRRVESMVPNGKPCLGDHSETGPKALNTEHHSDAYSTPLKRQRIDA